MSVYNSHSEQCRKESKIFREFLLTLYLFLNEMVYITPVSLLLQYLHNKKALIVHYYILTD